MKYYIDTEFLEGTQNKTLLGIPYGNTKPTIDLISIGIVAEDGREYYAISKDFNLKEAWNRYQVETTHADGIEGIDFQTKVYWLRDNVLIPMYHADTKCQFPSPSYNEYKQFIQDTGKSNKQIAKEIQIFIKDTKDYLEGMSEIEFYSYYGDYDWVIFCWLFGSMIDLPKGFPMYCIDLKQELDRRLMNTSLNPTLDLGEINEIRKKDTLKEKLNYIKNYSRTYPKETNEHNALSDAHWNKKLHKFLLQI